jgi:RNA polymerase sigma factor (TIGR02999 family)
VAAFRSHDLSISLKGSTMHAMLPVSTANRPVGNGPVTEYLSRWRAGDREALAPLVPLVYDELRGVARRQLRRESAAHTLSPTALVHETYLRLLRQRHLAAADRAGFLGIAAQTMRRVLVDHARGRTRLKRGGHDTVIRLGPTDEPPLCSDVEAEEILAIDRALDRLEQLDTRARAVVEHRVFAGLTLCETAAALGISSKSVQRTWITARAWLRTEIGRAA